MLLILGCWKSSLFHDDFAILFNCYFLQNYHLEMTTKLRPYQWAIDEHCKMCTFSVIIERLIFGDLMQKSSSVTLFWPRLRGTSSNIHYAKDIWDENRFLWQPYTFVLCLVVKRALELESFHKHDLPRR